MEKLSFIVFATMCGLVACVVALPRQYRYYPPSPSRFAGWTVTSQELLALPSQNDPVNVVRVAPPAGFVRPHHVSRRSARVPFRVLPYPYLNEDEILEYYKS